MPGIVGVFSGRPAADCKIIVKAMLESMSTEPFYVSGTRFSVDMGLYAGWVAHEDSFAAQLSACTHSDDIGLVFSGECFQDHVSTSTAFAFGCSLDDIQRLYSRNGDAFVSQLNGLFSGILIDGKRNRAILFNDRYGVERIYFHEKNGDLFFASEAKALLHVLPELREFDSNGVADFLNFGCTLDNRSLFRNIHCLPNASLWTMQKASVLKKSRYFSTSEWESQSKLTEDAFEEELLDTFNRILPRYFRSNSRIGISLTGGLDTRMIMSRIPPTATKPICYTYSGFSDRLRDLKLAKDISHACALEHKAILVDDNFLGGFSQYLDRTVIATDGYAGAMDSHEIYLSEKARKLSPIRLTGNYGSEVLRSMSTFKPVGLSPEFVDSDFMSTFLQAYQRGKMTGIHPVTFAAFREIPWRLFGNLSAGRSQITFRTPYLDNELTALAYRACDKSRSSPKASLTLVRANNLSLSDIPTDRGLRYAASSPAYFAKRAYSDITFKLDYLYSEGMPDWISRFNPIVNYLSGTGLLGLHKFLLYRRWFAGELSGYVGEVLHSDSIREVPYINYEVLDSMYRDHLRGHKNYTREIHSALTLEAVNRLLLKT